MLRLLLNNNCLARLSSRFYQSTSKIKFSSRPYEINSNVAKDVILFHYENPRFFKVLNVFGISQLVFWTYLSHFSWTNLKDAPVKDTGEDKVWYQKVNLGENKYKNSITAFCFIIGYGILTISWFYTLRSVRYLILRKGGQTASIVSYTPFGENRIIDVPLKCISAEESRIAAKTVLPIKVKNKSLYYMLDMRGDFKNTSLYDYTVGLRRKL